MSNLKQLDGLILFQITQDNSQSVSLRYLFLSHGNCWQELFSNVTITLLYPGRRSIFFHIKISIQILIRHKALY